MGLGEPSHNSALLRRLVPALRLNVHWIAPASTVAIGGWIYRWTSDDGFIYLRVVANLLAGNGPVYNAGERVEAATGPLWVALIALGRLATGAQLESIAAIMGIGLSCLGVALAGVAAHRIRPDRLSFVGVQAFSLVPFTWHFASSGLETGLGFAWIGAMCLVVVRPQTTRLRTALTGLAVGLGPLIRPDFALISGALLLWLSVSRTGRVGYRWALLAGAMALPSAYQLFRMAYYRAVIPNTAIAKEASSSYWGQGLKYLLDAITSPLALVLFLVGSAIALRRDTSSKVRFLAATGLVYGLAIVRGGGDFMRLRMFLPVLLILGVATASLAWVAHLRTLRWVSIIALAGLIEAMPLLGVANDASVTNEFVFYSTRANHRNAVTLADYASSDLYEVGVTAAQLSHSGVGAAVEFYDLGPIQIQPLDDGTVRVGAGSIGVIGMASGLGVYVTDIHGLASPVASRIESERRGRPGHEKILPRPWLEALLGIDSVGADAANRAMTCGAIGSFLTGISAPMSLEVALDNFRHALSDTFMRLPSEPGHSCP